MAVDGTIAASLTKRFVVFCRRVAHCFNASGRRGVIEFSRWKLRSEMFRPDLPPKVPGFLNTRGDGAVVDRPDTHGNLGVPSAVEAALVQVGAADDHVAIVDQHELGVD